VGVGANELRLALINLAANARDAIAVLSRWHRSFMLIKAFSL
jgi:hypothetical protein